MQFPDAPTTMPQGSQFASAMPGHYGEDWWFLTYLGWSHTEAGNTRTGRTLAERAISLRAENANAAHGLSTHCSSKATRRWPQVSFRLAART